MSTKVVVFDLWNTLVHDRSNENHEEIARLLGFENREKFWEHCDQHFFGRNKSFYDFIKELIQDKGLPEGIFEKIKELWESSKENVNIFPDTISTLERLKGKYKLAILSNSAGEDSRQALKRLSLEKYFDYIILSCEVELSKPDPRIFQLVLDHFKVKPEEVLFVGDNLKMDIVPARILGMRGVLVDNRGKYPEYKDEEWYIQELKKLTSSFY